MLVEGLVAAVLWMEQAQRLQEVSATLLDTVPVASPIAQNFQLGIRADVSFLPAPNAKVGSKIEPMPSAPAQMIPSLYSAASVPLGSNEALSGEVWGGYLPEGSGKLVGLKAALRQTQWGGRAELSSARLGSARLVAGGGYAVTSSSLSGTISSSQGTDTFTARSVLTFVNLAVQHSQSGLWGGVMLGKKNTNSRLSIVEDNTDLQLSDNLSNAKQPHWTQVSLGVQLGKTVSIALSELMVPDRADMPRLSLAWSFFTPSGALRE